MRPAAVIFDVDGTLAETERDGHRIAFNRAFADTGLAWRWNERLYGELLAVTGGRERIAHYARQYDPDWLGRARAPERLAALHARKNAHYAAIVESGELSLRPGLPAMLDELAAAKVRLAIATTTSRANVDVLLRATLGGHAAAHFGVVVCGEDVTRKKPDPEVYTKALLRLQLPPERCIAVEDSSNGLRAALAAAVPAVVVRSLYTTAEDFSGALRVFEGYRGDTGGGELLSSSFLLGALDRR